MKIKMLKDFKVAPDGYTVETWHEGEIKEAPLALAADLCHSSTVAAVEWTGDKKTDDAALAAAAIAAKKLADQAAATAAAIAPAK